MTEEEYNEMAFDPRQYEEHEYLTDEEEEGRDFDSRYLSQAYKCLEERMEDFFNYKCKVIMLKRDKAEIVAEVRKQAMDNLFKEEK